jgi:ribosomal-protein-alanine N-acetyltransferase
VFPAYHRWPVTIEFGPVVLVPFRRRDIGQWLDVKQRNAEWLRRWDSTNPHSTGRAWRMADTRRMVANFIAEAQDGRMLPWLIRYRDPDMDRLASPSRLPLIGQCSVSNIGYGAAQMGSIGYWIDQGYAGRGIMPRAVALATDYAMAVMGLHRLEVNILPENQASLRVVAKLGFRDEGVRVRYLHIAGQWRDHRAFALDSSDIPQGLCARLMG